MPSITCTNCGAVLKTQNPVPPGKKVKCPKCSEAFVVQAEVEPEPEQPKKTPALPPELEDDDNAFAGIGGGEEKEKPKPKKRRKPADEEVADGETGAEKPKQKSNKTLYFVVGGVFIFLTCCVCLPTGGFFGLQYMGNQAIEALKKAEQEMKKAQEEQNKKLQEFKKIDQKKAAPVIVNDKKDAAPPGIINKKDK